MNETALRLPLRAAKPRPTGLTMVVDGGIPLATLRALVESAGEYIDLVKFGWGTAVVSRELGQSPRRWAQYVEEDLAAGARLVTLEARESGSSGICRPDGRLRFGLVEDLVATLPVERLLFELSTASLQAHLVRRLGPDVNLGNVPVTGVISLETLRLGLRAHTLVELDPAAGPHWGAEPSWTRPEPAVVGELAR